MKIVVIGGNGLIGKQTVEILRDQGHDVISASRSSGINAVTGEGVASALEGADVVVDVSNSPSFEDKAVFEFFDKSTRNLLQAEENAGVKHHVALSVVGSDKLPDSGYMRAKVAQERLIKAGKIPYTIIQATQFFEFLDGIAQAGSEGNKTRLSNKSMQPIAAQDVSEIVAEYAIKPPANSTIEIGGPERLPLSKIVEQYLQATDSKLQVIPDAEALYFGTKLTENSLTPAESARTGQTNLKSWLQRQVVKAVGLLLALGLTNGMSALAQPSSKPSAAPAVKNDIPKVMVSDAKSSVKLVYDHVLPNVPGKSIKGVLVEYKPGGSSPAHTHPKSAFIYATVLEGAIKSQVNGGPVITYKEGESFSENPGDKHGVSENASKTKPAKLLAVFVLDSSEKELTTVCK